MKIKMNLYITDTEAFFKDNRGYCYALAPDRNMDSCWLFCNEVELDVDVNMGEVVEVATAELEEKIAITRVTMGNLIARKAELLALPAPDCLTEEDIPWSSEESIEEMNAHQDRVDR